MVHSIPFLALQEQQVKPNTLPIMFKIVVFCGCLLAVAQAGVIGGPLLAGPSAVALQPATIAVPTITTSNIIRGIGNLGAVTAFSKSVDTPFSSVRKADVRVNNPDILRVVSAPALAVANTAFAAPVATAAIAAPGLVAGPAIAGLSPLGLGAPLGLGHVKVLG